jgi:hypothetical protein
VIFKYIHLIINVKNISSHEDIGSFQCFFLPILISFVLLSEINCYTSVGIVDLCPMRPKKQIFLKSRYVRMYICVEGDQLLAAL